MYNSSSQLWNYTHVYILMSKAVLGNAKQNYKEHKQSKNLE